MKICRREARASHSARYFSLMSLPSTMPSSPYANRPREAAPVMNGQPMHTDAGIMRARRIADIGLPAILRMLLMQPAHQPVALDLGEDRGGGDRQGPPVAADDRRRRAGQAGRPEPPVDQRMRRRLPERRDHGQAGARHRQQAGMMDVDRIDLLPAGMGDGMGGMLADRLVQRLALLQASAAWSPSPSPRSAFFDAASGIMTQAAVPARPAARGRLHQGRRRGRHASVRV